MKTTLKDIKGLSRSQMVKDVTYMPLEELRELLKEEIGHTIISYSIGTYGISGVVFQGNKSRQLYAITSRTRNLWIVT